MKQWIKIALTSIFSWFILGVSAQSSDALFDEGNALYGAGNVEQALDKYLSIEQSGEVSKELYYNIGNCYYKLNNVGATILYYERALRMAPGDDDVLFNLQLANLRTVDQFETVPTFFLTKVFRETANWFNSTVWAVLFNLFFFAFVGGIAWFVFSNSYQRKQLVLIGVIIAFILSITLFGFAYSKYQYETSDAHGVISVSNTYVKSSPDENGMDVFMLHEGTKVEVLEELSGWQRIRVEDGKKGWVESTSISII